MALLCTSEVPGALAKEIVALPSLNAGRKSLPIIGYNISAPTSSTPVMASTANGASNAARRNVRCTIHFIARITKPSSCSRACESAG